MANEVSFSMSKNGSSEYVLAAGSQTVTEGTSAPGAGDIEVRLASTVTVAWTKKEIEIALDTIFRFLSDPGESTSIAL